MRLIKLMVEAFQAVERAEIEFGPGLNILFGPNDLGKSTLATAIRAALLVMPSSSEARSFSPWHVDATPRVALTFTDEAGHYWRVTKAFGASSANVSAELHHSKDGKTFELDCKERQVEERIRKMLAWGIPGPGGKGAPRGLPSSFLSTALLGTQQDVDAILSESIANDQEGSGHLRLTKALATLAQDPIFKKILDAAQTEVDQCFTATGRKKSGGASKFAEATRSINLIQSELDASKQQLQESAEIEEKLNTQRELRNEAAVRAENANQELIAARANFALAQTRAEAATRLAAANEALVMIDAQAAKVQAVAAELDALTISTRQEEERVAAAIKNAAIAQDALRHAEESYRVAMSEDGGNELALRSATLSTEKAEVTTRIQALGSKRTELLRIKATHTELVAARKLTSETEQKLKIAQERLQAAAIEAEDARGLLAFGRWRSRVIATEQSQHAARQAATALAEAANKEATALALDGEAKTITADVLARRALIPTQDETKIIVNLSRALELAEAKLGGGLSVVVTPKSAVALSVRLDKATATLDQASSNTRIFEAERSAEISIDQLVDIQISAGSADNRRAVERLRQEWSTSAAPLLLNGAMTSAAELTSAHQALDVEEAKASEATKRVEQLRADASNLRERAAIYDAESRKSAPSEGDLAKREAEIGEHDREALSVRYEKLGKQWEQAAESAHKEKSEAHAKTVLGQASLVQALDTARERCAATQVSLEGLCTQFEESEVESALVAAANELSVHEQRGQEIESALSLLAAAAQSRGQQEKQAVEAAKANCASLTKKQEEATTRLGEVTAQRDRKSGELSALKAALATSDRSAAQIAVTVRTAELGALPAPPAVSEAEVAKLQDTLTVAEKYFRETTEDLFKSEGALSKVGGSSLRDDADRLREALSAALDRQQVLELDAEAWLLLRDTLRGVENEEGEHLGRALGGPVAERFTELTGGRYKRLSIGPKLQTQSIEPIAGGADGDEVIQALSVGTRDQLATLIRLSIAEQLKAAIVLDDHLVNTDPKRLAWFRELLMKTALSTQVIVLTCRAEDYLLATELPRESATLDLAGGALRAIDAGRLVERMGI